MDGHSWHIINKLDRRSLTHAKTRVPTSISPPPPNSPYRCISIALYGEKEKKSNDVQFPYTNLRAIGGCKQYIQIFFDCTRNISKYIHTAGKYFRFSLFQQKVKEISCFFKTKNGNSELLRRYNIICEVEHWLRWIKKNFNISTGLCCNRELIQLDVLWILCGNYFSNTRIKSSHRMLKTVENNFFCLHFFHTQTYGGYRVGTFHSLRRRREPITMTFQWK